MSHHEANPEKVRVDMANPKVTPQMRAYADAFLREMFRPWYSRLWRWIVRRLRG